MFKKEIEKAYDAIKTRSYVVHPGKWQSVDVSTKPEMATHELLNYTLRAQVTSEDLEVIRKEVEPNLPWADDHFLERVGGVPLNPGEQWKHWPWGHSADRFRTESVDGPGADYDEETRRNELGFSHTYAERMWPKKANLPTSSRLVNEGIRYAYGDAMDVVEHLAKEPLSRQAFLPIWFPEDTGKLDVRVPCTLGYHFIQRSGYLHCTYYIRSCDIYRHFRDDIYLTVRLQLWMLDELRKRDSNWNNARPGSFTMHIVSLHCFRNDYLQLFK